MFSNNLLIGLERKRHGNKERYFNAKIIAAIKSLINERIFAPKSRSLQARRLRSSQTLPFAFLFRKTPNFDESFIVEKLKDSPTDFSRIRCPLCQWKPHASSRWFCADDSFHNGCGTAWNTFDTRGICPGCQYQWRKTDCLRCYKSSPHEAWYENSE